MPHDYIVGYDASAPSRAALDFTRELGRRTGVPVIAAHVYPSPDGLFAAPIAGPARFAGGAAGASGSQAVAERLLLDVTGDIDVRAWAGGSVPRELHALALAQSAALLAVGATHHGRIGRLALGSIAERVVHGAPCPVLVVPQGDGGRSVARIAMAYDGRVESRRALRISEALAVRLGASVRLVTAVDDGPIGAFGLASGDELGELLESRCREVLEQAATRLRQAGISVQTQLVLAPAGPGIVSACADDVDLLVTGSRDYGPARSVMLGSTSRYVVDHPPCPVLVVPRGSAISTLSEPLAATA